MVVVFISIIIGEINLVYCRNGKINYILKELGIMIPFTAGDAIDLIVVIVEKARDGIATTAIDLEISFKQMFISNYAETIKTTSTYFARIVYS